MSWNLADLPHIDERILVKRVRGLMLGLVLGEALQYSDRTRIPPTTGAQLACITAESTIRWEVRASEKTCYPPSVLWHGLQRWGHERGLVDERVAKHWTSGTAQNWPDGWLVGTPAMGVAEGSSPTTVAAIRAVEMPSPDSPPNDADSYQCLVRALPLAVGTPRISHFEAKHVRACVALTHGSPAAAEACLAAVELLGELLRSPLPLGEPGVIASTVAKMSGDAGLHRSRLTHAIATARPQPERVKELASDTTAWAALFGGLYAASSARTASDVSDALKLSQFQASQSKGVGAVAGALLGAAHGPDVFDAATLARLDLGWVADTLARDMVDELLRHPDGAVPFMIPSGVLHDPSFKLDAGEVDPFWRSRYPGW